MKVSIGRVMALAAAPMLLLAIGAGSAAAQPGSGSPPPPAGFEVSSASFISAQTGFVLGARKCSLLTAPTPCKALVEKTVNGGKSWTKVPAPAVQLQPSPTWTTTPADSVSEIVFANANDGWLYGPGLWATTDGGKQWHKQSIAGNQVVDISTAGGEVYASVMVPESSILGAKVYEGAVGSGKWSPVAKVAPLATLTTFGHSAWAGVSPAIWTTTNSGKTWTKLSFHCPANFLSSSQVAAASASNIAIACSDQGFPQPGLSEKEVFVSSNGGRTFHEVGVPPVAGQVYSLVMPPGKTQDITMGAASGASYLYRSLNGGKVWTTTTYFDGGTGMRDLAYASATTGYVVRFSGTPALAYGLGLMKTVNDGKTWTKVTIH